MQYVSTLMPKIIFICWLLLEQFPSKLNSKSFMMPCGTDVDQRKLWTLFLLYAFNSFIIPTIMFYLIAEG